MINKTKILFLVTVCILLQDCSTNSVENDFSYESLTDTIDGTPFRNRKYDYARVKVTEEKSLKIPAGLNGEKIKPALKLPEGTNNYAKSQVEEAEKNMLPPNYSDKFDMAKIIDDQIAKVAISVVYDDSGALKLVFREPLPITLNLLQNYFKDRKDNYKIISQKDEILSGHLIRVKDLKQKVIFIIFCRDIDGLSSLVKINAVFMSDEKTSSPDHIDQGVKLMSDIRKAENGIELNKDNMKIAKQMEIALSASSASTNNSKDSSSSLGGLLGNKKSSFSLGSYDRTVVNSKQEEDSQRSKEDYTAMTAPSDDQVYNSDAQAQVLNT